MFISQLQPSFHEEGSLDASTWSCLRRVIQKNFVQVNQKKILDSFQLWKETFKIKNKSDQEKLELTGSRRQLELGDVLSNVSSCDEMEGFPPPYAYCALPPTSGFNFHFFENLSIKYSF